MKYEQIRNLVDEPFRRLKGVKRQTFEKMVQILTDNSKNKKFKSGQNGSTKKLIGKRTGRGTGFQFRKKSN